MTQKERIEEINKLWEEIKNNNWLIQLMVSDQVFEDMREKLIIPSRDMQETQDIIDRMGN